MRRMKIRMELTEASVTEDITPFERGRLREALGSNTTCGC
jgi:hypothetical protein